MLHLLCPLLCLLPSPTQADVAQVGVGLHKVLVLRRTFPSQIAISSPRDEANPVWILSTPDGRLAGRVTIDHPDRLRLLVTSSDTLWLNGKQQGEATISVTYADRQTSQYAVAVIPAHDVFAADTTTRRVQVRVGEGKIVSFSEPGPNTGPAGGLLSIGDNDICSNCYLPNGYLRLQGERLGLTDLLYGGGGTQTHYLIEVVKNPHPVVIPDLPPVAPSPRSMMPASLALGGLVALIALIGLRTRRLHRELSTRHWSQSLRAASRPSLRFGVGTLLVFTAAVAIALGIWSDRARRQQRAVAKLRAANMLVEYPSDVRSPAEYEPASADLSLDPNDPDVDAAESPEHSSGHWLEEWLDRDYVEPVTIVKPTYQTAQEVESKLTEFEDERVQIKKLWAEVRKRAVWQTAAKQAEDIERVATREKQLNDRISQVERQLRPVPNDALAVLSDLPHLQVLVLPEGVDPGGLKYIADLTELESLSVVGPIADQDLIWLSNLKQLRSLSLWQAHITDEGIQHLARLKQLEELTLQETQLTDAGLTVFKNFPRLDSLQLEGDFRDAGLRHLRSCVHLKWLRLQSPFLTDAGIPHLLGLRKLVGVDFHGSQITFQGLLPLYEACANLCHPNMPGCLEGSPIE